MATNFREREWYQQTSRHMPASIKIVAYQLYLRTNGFTVWGRHWVLVTADGINEGVKFRLDTAYGNNEGICLLGVHYVKP